LKDSAIKVVTTEDLDSPELATFDVGFSRELLTLPAEWPQPKTPIHSKKDNHPKKGELREVPTQSTLTPANPPAKDPAAITSPPKPHPSDDFDVQRSYIHIGDVYQAVFKNDRSAFFNNGRISAARDVMIGARMKMTTKDHKVIVEIQPNYMLTDGTVGILTTRSLLEKEKSSASRATNAERIASTKGQYDKTQNVAAAADTEADTFYEIAKYAEAIAPVGRIYIRIHVGDRDIPAKIEK
jgi:hypothetical protein